MKKILKFQFSIQFQLYYPFDYMPQMFNNVIRILFNDLLFDQLMNTPIRNCNFCLFSFLMTQLYFETFAFAFLFHSTQLYIRWKNWVYQQTVLPLRSSFSITILGASILQSFLFLGGKISALILNNPLLPLYFIENQL